MNKFAEFYKCALQVNPYSYVSYRGEEHTVNEEEYNALILKHCLEEDIRVIGLADHGNIQSSEKLRSLLSEKGIIVFPGFEIATAEKIHIVCLFSEDTSADQLNRYLGRLGLTDVENGVMPSNFSCLEVARIVEDELNGFWYAAHITSDNGILKMGQMNHIWQNKRLLAAQIPYGLYDVDPKYLNIIRNKETNYKRIKPLAYINAKDICKPEDLLEKNAYCLVKMSEVNFSCFKQAFQDPSARVKLSYDLNELFQSSIDKISVYGGYLDGLSVDLSKNLNTLIGGRGTGKSTLIELIRYALGLSPKSEDAKKDAKELIKANLGLEGGRIELYVTSHHRYGQKYKIIKRYNDPIVIENIDGTVSNMDIKDILPHMEIYGQNEIIELIKDEEAKLNILNRFLPNPTDKEMELKGIIGELEDNAVVFLDTVKQLEEIKQKISKLPILEEKERFFREAGIAEKLPMIQHLSTEEEYMKKSLDGIVNHKTEFHTVDIPFSEEKLTDTPNKELFLRIKDIYTNFNLGMLKIKDDYEKLVKDNARLIDNIKSEWEEHKKESEGEIQVAIKTLDGVHGKTGPEIAMEYRETVSEIAKIHPSKGFSERLEEDIKLKEQERITLIEKMKKNKDESYDILRRAVKKINKGKLKGKVQIDIHPGKNRDDLIKMLSEIEGIGVKSLEGIKTKEDFSIFSFLDAISEGSEKLSREYGLTKSKADTLSKLPLNKIFELEVVQLLDIIDIKLNTGNLEDQNFKSLNSLSKGQQCTAILNILMLDNNDPLIIDQPEDNLDNAYIANNFVDGLREYKLNRQFLFATHNANIPVFGDAELIIVMNEADRQGYVDEQCLGSVDNQNVKDAVINTLEGGNVAFQMRKVKYNL